MPKTMNVELRPGVAQGCTVAPSPNEGKILRALQEETQGMRRLVGRNMGGGHLVPDWQGYFDLDEIHEVIERRDWCRGNHWNSTPYVWSMSTVRAHLRRLMEKGWVEGRIDEVTHRALYRVKVSRRRPLFECYGLPPRAPAASRATVAHHTV